VIWRTGDHIVAGDNGLVSQGVLTWSVTRSSYCISDHDAPVDTGTSQVVIQGRIGGMYSVGDETQPEPLI